jgi:hypothetical protein
VLVAFLLLTQRPVCICLFHYQGVGVVLMTGTAIVVASGTIRSSFVVGLRSLFATLGLSLAVAALAVAALRYANSSRLKQVRRPFNGPPFLPPIHPCYGMSVL